MEQAPEPRQAETIKDLNIIARALLQEISGNQSGALGGEIINNVQRSTGYMRPAVALVFAELAEQGILDRSLDNPQGGVALTAIGLDFLENFDELMPDKE
jgi:hypothetical protein